MECLCPVESPASDLTSLESCEGCTEQKQLEKEPSMEEVVDRLILVTSILSESSSCQDGINS